MAKNATVTDRTVAHSSPPASLSSASTVEASAATSSPPRLPPLFKLSLFPSGFSSEEVLLHQDDFPGVTAGDVVEIYHPPSEDEEEHWPRLLLQVTARSLDHPEQTVQRKTVLVEKSIADEFKLHNFKDVVLRKVSKVKAALDSVELTFREQYLGRSEMWRIKSELINTCVFKGKKVDVCQGAVRCQVHEMWSGGDMVACGVINADTKVVFRSPTAMVYLFIQMSSEMWDFDERGMLYYEKAVDGFLADMFAKWHASGSSHEVTIVLFGRCFYDATSKAQFPIGMRACLHAGCDGGIFEDFYRVVVQNERFDDWNPTLLQLRKLFTDYKGSLKSYHQRAIGDSSLPKARISSAEQGNFLEVLNMSLNTFEHHYLNRNLERTGQQSIVITPGVGIFEVDRQLAQITKQRIIDSGVGSDLICLGTQPLHAVPLLKFRGHSQGSGGRSSSCRDDFSMPHWINLSFYTTQTRLGSTVFRPRIKVPGLTTGGAPKPKPALIIRSDFRPPADEDEMLAYMEKYDEKVWAPPQQRQQRLFETISEGGVLSKKMSYPDLASVGNSDPVSEQKSNISIVGSLDSPFDHQTIKRELLRPGRAVVNPFDPSHTTTRLTSNRRRWTHIFPKGPTGNYGTNHSAIGGTSSMVWAPGSAAPDVAAGVDWKSLTIPASLPITTDYFPGEKALADEYTLNEYTIEPDEINADFRQRSPMAGAPLSTAQVFTELISQRLAQGFQLILNPPCKGRKKCTSIYGECLSRKSSAQVWLSIGHIFHKICLEDDTISVTIFRPAAFNPSSPNLRLEYRYRFQAPDNDTYEVSWVDFRTEKLENYNWNHMDYYVCTKGDRDYPLKERLKYWRFRMFVLPQVPDFTACTKKILSNCQERCDLYGGPLPHNPEVASSFLRFVDSCLNHLKRIKQQDPEQGPVALPAPLSAALSQESLSDSTLQELAAHMQSPSSGLTVFASSSVLPAHTFLSFDFVSWLTSKGDLSRDTAIALGQQMLDRAIIRHASGSKKQKRFSYGYCMFTFSAASPYRGDLEAFEDDFVEIALIDHKEEPTKFKLANVRVLNQIAAEDRPEWLHLLYSRLYHEDVAFEVGLHWSVATGAAVHDLAQGWARKASQCSFTLVPIPGDPFALPITANSDPVRGPIFVEIARGENTPDLASRDAIARRFGFVPCARTTVIPGSAAAAASFSTDNQYVHYSGNMFLLIPTQLQLCTGIQGIKAAAAAAAESEEEEEFLQVASRTLSEAKPSYDHSRTGFLWSWNFTISRRWKQMGGNTGATGDIEFMDKILADFRAFCANADGRLEQFLQEFNNVDPNPPELAPEHRD